MKLGVSAYVGLKDHPIEKTIVFLQNAKKLGIEYVFTSCHIPESSIVNDFNKLLEAAEKLSLKLIIDVSKPMMENFTVPRSTYALRLDYGFSIDDMVDMSKKLPCMIELNASIVSYDFIIKLLERGVKKEKLRVSYNFYPKKYTGMSLEEVIEKTRIFHELGLEVMGYLPSLKGSRPPMYEGLPTIESHRYKCFESAVMEFKVASVDAICIGDSYPSDDELLTMTKANDDCLVIPLLVTTKISDVEKALLTRNHRSRLDQSPYMVRSSTRVKEQILSHDQKAVCPFDVTIDNHFYLRYQGEVGIALKPMPANERVNVVGHILEDGHDIVRFMKPGTPFKFVIHEK